MSSRSSLRLFTTGLLVVGSVAAAPAAQAAVVARATQTTVATRPEPEPSTVVRPGQADLRVEVLTLTDEGGRGATVAQRHLLHHDLIQSLLDAR